MKKGSKKPTKEQKAAIFCVMHGHSPIVEMCFGEVTCARCGDRVGDALMGSWNGEGKVIVGHKCEVCDAVTKSLTKKDVTWVPKEKLEEIGYAR